jgi:glycosyltransferase involved in cell wall biosynthesis
MKIFLVHNNYRTSAPSGEDIVVGNERRMLEKHCEVVTCFKHNDVLDETTLSNRLGMAANAVWSMSSYREIAALLEKTRPDLVHVHNTFPQLSPSVYAAAKRRGVPVIQTLHNYRIGCANGLLLRGGRPCELCLDFSPLSALRYKCYRDSIPATATVVGIQMINRVIGSYRKNVDTFVALTKFAKNKLQIGGLADSNFVVKPNFLPDPPPPGGYPRERQAVFVGRLTEEKGVWTLIRAWSQTKGHKLVVAGDGALRDELEKYVASKKLNVVFLGQCKRDVVLDLLRRSSLQIIPSLWYEGFPMVVLEAYACGTAVLASRLGGLAEVVVEGETGRLFPAGDVDSLARQINELLQGDEAERLGAGGRSLFEREYTEDKNVRQLLAIYDDALKRSKDVGVGR